MKKTKKKLIIIDDDKATINYNAELAKKAACFERIYIFPSAEDALQFLEQQLKNEDQFDGSMIIDVFMEEMSGLEFLDEIDERELVKSSTEILILTGKNSVRSREKTKIAYLKATFGLKPLTEEHLLSLV